MTAGASVQAISRRVLPWMKCARRTALCLRRYLIRKYTRSACTSTSARVVIQKKQRKSGWSREGGGGNIGVGCKKTQAAQRVGNADICIEKRDAHGGDGWVQRVT